MNSLKTVTFTCAAVLAVACVPFFWQKKAETKWRSELAELESRRTLLDGEVRVLAAARVEAERSGWGSGAGEVAVRTVGDLLAATEEPIDAATLINSLMEMMMSRDMVGMLRLFLPVANLSTEEYGTLMDEIQAYEGNPQMKEMAVQMLAGFAPSGNPKDSLERMIALDVQPHGYAGKLGEWAGEDPEAALAWFEAKRAAGELEGKGVNNTPEQVLLASLVGGIAKKDPARALAIYEGTKDKDSRQRMTWQMGASFAANMKETGDDTYFRRLLDGDEDTRGQIVSSSVNTWIEDGKLDDGLAFIEKYLDDPGQRNNAVRDMLANQRSVPVAERGDWLVANVDRAALPEAVEGFVQRMAWERDADLDKWLSAQPAGEVRDKGINALANAQSGQGSYAQAFESVGRIGDAKLREQATENLARRWIEAEPAKASAALPPELTERLNAGPPK